jgi:putative ABC transport system substrate-binding protein
MVPLNTAEDLESGFATLTRDGVGGFLVLAGSFTFAYRDRLAELALKLAFRECLDPGRYVDAGGLMNYSPNLSDMVRRAAIYVDTILKGAKPADLPVEQASEFELVVNNRTAKAIGLTLAPAFLLRADDVIE